MFVSKNYKSKNRLTILTMINTLKVSSKGQIVIPEEVRRKLKVETGSTLIARLQGTKIILEKETDFVSRMEKLEELHEEKGWQKLAEKSLSELWDNKEDEEEWVKYL